MANEKNFACCGISPKGLLPEHSLPKAEILTDRACGAAFLIKALRRRVKKTLPPSITGILDAFLRRKSFRATEGTNPL